MITIKEYVEGLFGDIPSSEEKESIMQEIIGNMEEKVQDLIDLGKDEEDAINKAIVDFGDIEELKKDLMKAASAKGIFKKTEKKKTNYVNNLWYSVWASALIIGLVVFINYYYSPNTIWYVYPTFVVLWWPLTMVFAWLNNRKK